VSNYLGFVKHASTMEKFVPMADTIHKVGEPEAGRHAILILYRTHTIHFTHTILSPTPFPEISKF